MFKKNQEELALLKTEIARVHSELEAMSADQDGYETVLNHLVTLYGLLPEKKRLFSGDAVLGAVSNLLGIGIVIGYERMHVITSKAFSWIRPNRS